MNQKIEEVSIFFQITYEEKVVLPGDEGGGRGGQAEKIKRQREGGKGLKRNP